MHIEHACGDSGEDRLPFNRKKNPAELDFIKSEHIHKKEREELM